MKKIVILFIILFSAQHLFASIEDICNNKDELFLTPNVNVYGLIGDQVNISQINQLTQNLESLTEPNFTNEICERYLIKSIVEEIFSIFEKYGHLSYENAVMSIDKRSLFFDQELNDHLKITTDDSPVLQKILKKINLYENLKLYLYQSWVAKYLDQVTNLDPSQSSFDPHTMYLLINILKMSKLQKPGLNLINKTGKDVKKGDINFLTDLRKKLTSKLIRFKDYFLRRQILTRTGSQTGANIYEKHVPDEVLSAKRKSNAPTSPLKLLSAPADSELSTYQVYNFYNQYSVQQAKVEIITSSAGIATVGLLHKFIFHPTTQKAYKKVSKKVKRDLRGALIVTGIDTVGSILSMKYARNAANRYFESKTLKEVKSDIEIRKSAILTEIKNQDNIKAESLALSLINYLALYANYKALTLNEAKAFIFKESRVAISKEIFCSQNMPSAYIDLKTSEPHTRFIKLLNENIQTDKIDKLEVEHAEIVQKSNLFLDDLVKFLQSINLTNKNYYITSLINLKHEINAITNSGYIHAEMFLTLETMFMEKILKPKKESHFKTPYLSHQAQLDSVCGNE